MRPERGFALVAALFVMVVVAVAVAAMSRLSVTQNASLDLGIQQARAYQAARAGLEWGLHQLLLESNAGDCPAASNVSMAGSGLEDFTVSFACVKLPLPCSGAVCPESYAEGIRTFNLYRLTATADNGSPDSRTDHAWRRLEVTVER
ncbi:hypothetical protein NGA35_14520 [Pseudomonas stutzeri]|nr:hypothetical protein [Stutzerimonas stutzeri]